MSTSRPGRSTSRGRTAETAIPTSTSRTPRTAARHGGRTTGSTTIRTAPSSTWSISQSTAPARCTPPGRIAATADGTFTASFVKQFQATVGQDPAGLSVLVDDVSYTSPASFWWNDSSTHSLGAPSPQYATPDVRSVFSSWSDGGTQAHTVTATAPFSATATFVQEQGFRVSTAPANLSFKVDGTAYSAATTFWFTPGTYHIVSVETL